MIDVQQWAITLLSWPGATPLIQVTLLLVVCLLVHRLLAGQHPAVRHAMLATQLIAAPLLFAAAILEIKPDFTFRYAERGAPVVKVSTEDRTDNVPWGPPATWELDSWPVADSSSVPWSTSGDQSPVVEKMAQPEAFVCPIGGQAAGQFDSAPASNLPRRIASSGFTLASWPAATTALLIAWGVGVLWSSFCLVQQWTRLRKRIDDSQPVDRSQLPADVQMQLQRGRLGIQVRESRELMMPLTAGTLRPVILLPADFRDWPELEIRSVLTHEVAHVRRCDSLTNLCGYLSSALLWFHPLAWRVYARMRRECEHAADSAALQSGISPTDYAHQLVSIIRRYGRSVQFTQGTATMATPSHLQDRIDAVLREETNRKPSSFRRWALLPTIVLLPIIAASIRLEPVQAEQPSEELVASPVLLASCQRTSAAYAAERRENLLRREREALAATAALRRRIEERLPLLFDADGTKNHQRTALSLGKALARLGRLQDVEQLLEQIRASGDKDLLKAVRHSSQTKLEAYVARGDYEAAEEVVKSDPSLRSSWYAIIHGAIRNGDLSVAERMIADTATERSPNFHRGRLLDACADLATAAHWLGEEAIVELALQRFRSVIEETPLVSTRPLEEGTTWLSKDATFGRYFMLTLASCGQGALAERLWFDAPFDEQAFGGWSSLSSLNLCMRLVGSGQAKAARRIAQREFDNTPSAELLHTLCLRAISDGDHATAQKLANEYLTSIRELSFHYQNPWWGKPSGLSEQAQVLDRHRKASALLLSFIEDLKSQEQAALVASAAKLYVELADRFIDEFENRSTVADIQHLQKANWNLTYHLSLAPIVDVLSTEEVHGFVGRQQEFLRRNHAFFHNIWSSSQSLPEANALELARVGQSPEDASRFSVRTRCDLVERLLRAGNRSSARRVFDSVYQEVLKVSSLSYVSGSDGGRVVNGAVQNRYRAASLAVRCDRLMAGIDILEQIEHRGQKIDGYRCLAESYAEATDVGTAVAWANTLTDEDLQLAALVGILVSQTDRLVENKSELTQFLQELQGLGRPFWSWGC